MKYAQLDRDLTHIATFLHGDPDDWPDLRDADVLRPCGPEVRADWRWDGAAFVPPAPPAAPRIKSPLEFRRSFTPAERSAITLAAASEMQRGSTILQEFMDDLVSAGEVNLDSADLREGMDLLVWAELLTTERATVLLAG